MGQLYEIALKVNKAIEDSKLDKFQTRGKISLKTGFMLGLINANTPDDNDKIEKVKAAVKEILGISL
ncbi:MAG: hypothetical protein A2339_00355 [Elusimicrobia bacterium RIFOXYB12_FULL_50_12]|nr:MAG: hypothetical protein A2278_05955 [Elusimicrobia bacterium RIFOXYA12_FULL_49_49]OGS11321.1 MAG: hypothetical protein A2386_08375 [Elusimicrobia bacterium RIFOXYB1_FULL_48_9]OGS16662.1 MAG: hypothetical protein A2251_04780 [Elusimicrobia bacterium RIFOXYA2_FULL_47_53]OGS25511.1 MAG: hypothetical protein A2339_00355 [Elusimicrobia bacterium RIFOXYB12_FULL_50_12]OGS31640.1 MAG: hypothetical protein A2323_03500 [Elusimicrobia bacterium RIFOXYB2_FULL_46_23]